MLYFFILNADQFIQESCEWCRWRANDDELCMYRGTEFVWNLSTWIVTHTVFQPNLIQINNVRFSNGQFDFEKVLVRDSWGFFINNDRQIAHGNIDMRPRENVNY